MTRDVEPLDSEGPSFDNVEQHFEKLRVCDLCGKEKICVNFTYNEADNRSQKDVPDAGYEWICKECYSEIDNEVQDKLESDNL